MTESFARVVDPVFDTVAGFLDRVNRGQCPDLETQRREFTDALDEAGVVAGSKPELRMTFEAARYPLVYWIDEVAGGSRWAHAGSWRDRILEYQYFGTRHAFGDFWARASQAEQAALSRERAARASRLPWQGDDVLETYLWCVTLGFRGRAYLDEPALLDWVARIRPLVEPSAPAGGAPPVDERTWGLRPRNGDRMLVEGSWLVSLSIVAAVLGFTAAVGSR